MNELWTIGLAGAAVGGALGWPMLRSCDRCEGAGGVRLLGWLLLLGGLAAAMIAAQHGAVLPASVDRFAEHATHAGNLVFWAALVRWARAEMGRRTTPLVQLAMFVIPVGAYAAYALASRDVPRFVWLLPVGTVASIHVLVLWRNAKGRPDFRGALLSRMIGFALALNLAQAVRTFFPHIELLREIVPITMTAGFLSIAALAVREMLGGASSGIKNVSPPYAKSALDHMTAERLLTMLERGMAEGSWHRETRLSLVELARRLDTRPDLISQSLNQVKGVTLNDYLASWRLLDARRLLADPASDRFTIDALAETAGFASRSAFYKIFKAHEGMTPTEFRARSRAAARHTHNTKDTKDTKDTKNS